MWGRAAPRPPAGFVYGCAPKVCRVGVGGRDLGHFRDVVSRKRTFSSHWFPTYLERKHLLMECESIELKSFRKVKRSMGVSKSTVHVWWSEFRTKNECKLHHVYH